MSVATVKAIEEKLKGAPTQQLEKYGYTRDSSGHIVPKETAGIAAKPGTTAPPPSAAAKHAGPSSGSSLLEKLPFIGPSVTLGNAIGGAAEDLGATDPAGAVASVTAQPLAEGLIDLVKPVALKITLTAVLILGGMALAAYGLATMLKPEPPKLGELAKKAARAGASAA